MKIRRERSRGFTLMELMLSSILMSVAMALLASSWTTFGRPAINAVARCRVAQEANLAAAALAEDFGQLASTSTDPQDGRYANVQPGADEMSFSFACDNGKGTVVIVFYTWDVANANLVRAGSGQPRVVATLLSDLQVTASTEQTPQGLISGTQIQLTFTHPARDQIDGTYCDNYTRLYTLFVPDP